LRIKYKRKKDGEYTIPAKAFVSEYNLDDSLKYDFDVPGYDGPISGTILQFS
jgi:hypothetical protein